MVSRADERARIGDGTHSVRLMNDRFMMSLMLKHVLYNKYKLLTIYFYFCRARS